MNNKRKNNVGRTSNEQRPNRIPGEHEITKRDSNRTEIDKGKKQQKRAPE